MQRTVLYEDGCNRAAAAVQLGLDDGALRLTVRVRTQLLHVCGQQNHFEQVVNALAELRGNLADDGIAAPVLRYQLVLGQLLEHAVRVCVFLINLVDSDDDRDACRLGMVDCLDGLRHDAVIRCDNQNRNIGDLCAAGTHGRKCRMARGVEEGDRTAVDLDAVCTDVLRDAAGFACGNVGLADGVEQGGLTVVDMAHDDDNRASRLEVFFLVLALVKQLFLDGDKDFLLDLCAHLLCDDGSGIEVDGLGNVRHDAQLEQLLDDVCRGALQAGCQFADIDLIRDHDLELDLLDLLLLALQALELLLLLLTALAGELLAGIRLAGDLLLALLHAVCLLRHESVNALVIARKIHIAAAARIDAVNLLALALLLVLIGRDCRSRFLTGALRAQNLALLMWLCRLMALLIVVIALLLIGRCLLCLFLYRLRCSLLLRLGLLLRFRLFALALGSLLRRLLADDLCRRRLALCGLSAQDLLHIFHRMVLGHIIKYQIQFLRFQNLHMVFRGLGVFCQHIGDFLCARAKILGYFMYTVFIVNTHARSPPRFVWVD